MTAPDWAEEARELWKLAASQNCAEGTCECSEETGLSHDTEVAAIGKALQSAFLRGREAGIEEALTAMNLDQADQLNVYARELVWELAKRIRALAQGKGGG